MVRKKKLKVTVEENELYILPTPNDEMRSFVNKFKIDMMEHVVESIEFALAHKLPIIEVFQFKNSPFVVTLAEKEFESNLEHIYKSLMSEEIYELCPKVEKLREILKRKQNEKKQGPDNPNNPTQ